MESTTFFEKKLSVTPRDFNKIKNTSIDNILLEKAVESMENKCSEHGFVLPGSIKLISRSMGYFESARFTGDAIYYVKMEGRVIYPADGIRVIGDVIRKNKMGLYVDYRKAIRIQVPRDLHIGNKEYDLVEIGDTVEIELKRSKFQINDPYILASGLFITKRTPNTSKESEEINIPVIKNTEQQKEQQETESEEKEGEREEGQEGGDNDNDSDEYDSYEESDEESDEE